GRQERGDGLFRRTGRETERRIMLKADEKRNGDQATLTLSGRLDAVAAQELEPKARALVGGGCKRVVVDLAGLEFVASSGLRVFLALAKLVKRAGGKLAFCNLQAPVREVFDISGCTDIFTVVGTPEEADRAVQG
ncbi:MAG: STAS domain-containing protein, partial [Phycisphaerae bacterium]|nr:STAS domain-containing protein [Phycisphaerae bacterium]